ncbi:hypothetical protein AKJ53_00615 [candidate division MSBL1 archaeon SCGC-AAA382F02]|uniref:Uncharacterized protein n=1 Tax=candidate division MSBL1 archaeon SCGC-AAA382F02 TaxID=1698282 RepID=A0A133VIT3_9EURY|nr:hypothetical protein AKJ53_00615 [candidate division MSBL1 archaeon SCGC-AAA382F02]
MEDKIKVSSGIAFAVVGTGLLFLNSISPHKIIHFALMGAGLFLISVYCAISWDWFKDTFGDRASETLFVPALLTFGVLSGYYGITASWLVPPHDKVMLGLGIGIIAVSAFFLQQALKNKK